MASSYVGEAKDVVLLDEDIGLVVSIPSALMTGVIICEVVDSGLASFFDDCEVRESSEELDRPLELANESKPLMALKLFLQFENIEEPEDCSLNAKELLDESTCGMDVEL